MLQRYRLFRSVVIRNLSIENKPNVSLLQLSKHLDINETKAQFIALKYPIVKKLSEDRLISLLGTLRNLGYAKEILTEEPLLFSVLPVTLRFRYKVLQECGINNITSTHLVSYLTLIRRKTIAELKSCGEIAYMENIENRLAGYMTQWPTSLTTLICGDVNNITLYEARLKIIERYLELVLDLTKEEFHRGLQTYPTVKHRPLEIINETLTILQSQVLFTNNKIKSNFYLVHVDPENLKQIIFNFRSIAGIDIREVLRMHPKIATKSYSSLMEIRKILQEYDISHEAQRRCFDIYTLGPSTVKERLENAKTVPEFQTFINHPRFLKMIHYNTTAVKRIMKLYGNNKKCLSLNILSGSTSHYEVFEKAPGDRFGKVKDLVFCITQLLENKYNKKDVRTAIKRHPFWFNVPLIQVKLVFDHLSKEFGLQDLFENCSILLYPWNKVKESLVVFDTNGKLNQSTSFMEQLDVNKITKSQKLSLALYILEKNHYFSGNGVWSEERNKHVYDAANHELQKVVK